MGVFVDVFLPCFCCSLFITFHGIFIHIYHKKSSNIRYMDPVGMEETIIFRSVLRGFQAGLIHHTGLSKAGDVDPSETHLAHVSARIPAGNDP